MAFGLVLVTFDADLKDNATRRGCRCLYIRPPERTANARLREHYLAVTALLKERVPLVVLPSKGEPYASAGRARNSHNGR